MQTKIYFLLVALVGFSSFSGKLVAQTACFGYGSEPTAHAGYQVLVEEHMSFDGSEEQPALAALAGMTTYRVYLQTPSADDFVSAVMADGVTGPGEVHLNSTGSFYKNQFGGLTPNSINPLLFSYFPALEFDSFVTIGLDQEAVGTSEGDILLLGEGDWGPQFLSGGDLDIEASVAVAGGGWFILGTSSNGYAGEDNKVLLAQLTTDGELSGSLNIQIFPAVGGSDAAFTHQFSFTSEVCGCTDENADNYSAEATQEDGSCEYLGCTDATACNFDDGANTDDGTCDYCCAATSSTNSDYSVDVELFSYTGIPGQRTYRVYVHTPNETDALSAVAGYESNPANISTTTSFFQVPPPSGGVTPNTLNPVFLQFIPELEFDSYVTIGLTSAPTGGQGEVLIAQTPTSPWTTAFEAGGNIVMNSASGGAWFLSPGAPNAIAGPDKKILIGQFTTDGDLSGEVLVQVFPEGVQQDEIQFNVAFATPSCACQDDAACNYDPSATYDDGNCLYADDYYGVDYLDCDGNCLNDSDGDYVCDEDEVPGCLNPSACNYVDPSMVTDLVACVFPQFGYDCDGNCNNDTDGDGICDEFEIVDCTDETACNFNSDANADTDNSLCIYPEAGYDCEGVCLSDADGDGVCDEFEVAGCTDSTACNFDASATDDDASCDYCCYGGASVDGYSVSVEEVGTSPEGTVYRMYVNTAGSNDFVSAVTGTSDIPTYITTTQSFYQAPGYNSPFPTDFNAFILGLIPELNYDSWVTIGLDMAGGAGEGGPDYVASTNWVQQFNAGGDIIMDSEYGDGWFVTINQSNGLAGDDNRVLVGQFTTNGLLNGELYVQIFPNSDQANSLELSLPFGWGAENSGEGPVFTYVPADVTLACTNGLPTDMATAESGNCGGNLTVTFSDEQTGAACGEGATIVRTFTATDGWGNETTATQNITLTDDEAPVAIAQEDLVVECGTDITPGAGVAQEPTASYDACSDMLTYTYEDAPFVGTSNIDGSSMDIRVEMGLDIPGLFGQPYVLEATDVVVGDGPELTLNDIVQNPVSHRGAITVDISGGTMNLTFEGALTPNTDSYQYDYGRVIITNATADIAGLSIASNGIAPGADLSVTMTSGGAVVEWSGTATYTEGSQASLVVENENTCLENEGVIRTWTVSDLCGNSSTAVQTITFIDTEGPVLSMPEDLVHSCTESPDYGMATAIDCEGSVDVMLSESTTAGACASTYTIERVFTATDNCGNTTTATQTIQVVDDAAPVFVSVPEDATYEAGEDVPTTLAEATDNCGSVNVTFFDVSDASAGVFTTITRTFIATDDCGNTAEAIQTIIVNEILGCTDAIACNYNQGATYEDGSCDYCSCGIGGQDGFGLELELFAENGIPGQNTYRVYVTTPGPDDFISAVAGDVNNPAFLRTTTDFFQSQFGGLSAHEINPLFFAVVPSLQYDSWLTIGISQAPNSANGESQITFVEYAEDSWSEDFENGGDLEINSFFGGSWFALISSTNGVAGEDNRVLVAQLTTDGDVTGQLYVQVFPNGDQSQDTYLSLSFGGSACGCLDATACNYDDAAVYDDGTCLYSEDLYGSEYLDCDGVCVNDADGDGVCDEEEIAGCTASNACNYDASATDDDGTCEFNTCQGCTIESACNFDPEATIPTLDACVFSFDLYGVFGLDCDGNCLNDADQDGVCDLDEVVGCQDELACNYNASATDAGDCDYPSSIFGSSSYDCEGNCVNDSNGNGICDEFEITGCTDPAAMNFNPVATQDDDSCSYGIVGCILPWAPNYNPAATIQDLPISETCGFPNVGGMPDPATSASGCDDFSACNYGPGGDPSLPCDYSCFGCTNPNACDYSEEAIYNIGCSDYTSCVGCTNASACNYDDTATIDDASCEFGSCSGCMDEMACNYDSSATVSLFGSCVFPVNCETCSGESDGSGVPVPGADSDGDGVCDVDELAGCTNPSGCNYNPAATDDDGSCDFEECAGCLNPAACNYEGDDPSITLSQPIECVFPEEGYDCEGFCLNDADQDGICDEDDECIDSNGDLICDAIQGCDDETACNYDPSAEQPDAFFCDYCSCPNIESSNPDYSIEIEEYAVDGVPGATTYRLYVTTANPTDALNAILGNESNPIVLGTSSQFFQDPAGSHFPTNPMMFGFTPQLEWDSYVTIGDDTPAEVLEYPMATGGMDPNWLGEFESGNSIVIDDEVGSGWFIEAGLGGEYGIAGDDNRILFAQLTTPGTLFGSVYLQIFPEGQAAGNTIYVAATFGDSRCGCTDDMACNYNGAMTDDGSCYYDDDCENTCLYDTTAPTIDAVEDYTTSCDEADSDIREPQASDNCDGDLVFTFTDVIETGDCPNSYTIIRTWTVTDNSGYTASADQTISVVDNEAPTFTIPADISIACGEDASDLSLTGGVSEVADNCGGDTFVSYEDAAGTSNCFDGDVIIRTWMVEDACGNFDTAEQTITIVDEVAPYFTSVPADVTISCGDASPTEMAAADDACTSVTVTVAETTGEVNCTGQATIIRTFTATDGCGNVATAQQTVTILDEEGPSFTAPANTTVSCGGDASPSATGEPTDVDDNCSASVDVSYSDATMTSDLGCFADDVIERTWTAVDGCGNETTAVQLIQFVDDVAPEMDAVPAMVQIACGEMPSGLPGATDACSDVEVTFEDAAGDVNCTGLASIIRTYTAMDACGNFTTGVTEFVYTDDVAPTFTVPADLTVECSTDLTDLALVGAPTNIEDNCAGTTEATYEDSFSTSDGSCLQNNVVTRTWTVADQCGNPTTAIQTITLEDTTAPEVTYEASVNLTYYNGEQLPDFEGVTVMDACSDWTHETTDVYSSVNGFGYSLLRTITVTDACGNSTTIEQNINVDLYGGCTYEEAANYDATAILDDGSCEYAGCTDPAAANYDELYTIEDGSCLVVGCMDPDGLDYNADATFPGGCDYPDPCPGDLNEDGNVNVGDLLEFFQLYGTSCE